jgi:DNA-binding FadR family transcriptional regulator
MACAARNPVLDQMRAMLSGRVSRARYFANISTPRWDQAMKEHDEILAALKARDGNRLGSVLKAHLAHKLETLRGVLHHKGEITE